jgi:hypothetical protein
MKIYAFKTKDNRFTADLYTYTISRDSEGKAIRNYTLNRSISLLAVTASNGRLTCYFDNSESDIKELDQLANLRDSNGVELRDNGVYEVEAFAPAINTWGHREGFKARIGLIGFDQ